MQPLVPLVFHNLPSLYPPSFRRNDFLYLYNVRPAISKVKVTSFLVTHCTVIIIITDDVMIMIVNNVDSTKLEYLNSAVMPVIYMYETIDTRCDTDWILKLSLIPTTPSK